MPGLGMNSAAAQAFARFGLGGRPDDVAPSDARAWLLSQLSAPDAAYGAGQPSTAAGLALEAAYDKTAVGSSARTAAGQAIADAFQRDVEAYLANAVMTTTPFRERLVWFWSNHFAIMAETHQTRAVAGAFVREAIRPYVTGRFSDMLLAVVRHPAMLFSLNNITSIGPGSAQAVDAAKHGGPALSINENLGRELLELYTVGIAAGYSQADVDALAMLLTGWTVNLKAAPLGFAYDPTMAQPGSQVLMGNSYACSQTGCSAALGWLATHPQTYQHLATKLVTHFVSDTPADADVQTVARALASTGGSLLAAEQALVGLPSAWTPLSKLRSPFDLVIAALRALGASAGSMPAIGPVLRALGQPLWEPPFPNGWSDLAASWTGPQPMLQRVSWLNQLCSGLTGPSAATVANAALGPFMSTGTAAQITRAATLHDQLTLLFCSPEFQRR